MSTFFFVAEVTGGAGDGYQASFPDLPDRLAKAKGLSELLAEARHVVLKHLQALSEAGEDWPSATPLEAVAPKPGAVLILVDVAVDDPPVRVNISLGERLLARLDAAAEARSMSRSGFIAHAVRVSLGERENIAADFDAVSRRLQDELNGLGRRINDSIGPESPFSRRMAEFDDFVLDGVRKAADSVSAAVSRRKRANDVDPEETSQSTTSSNVG